MIQLLCQRKCIFDYVYFCAKRQNNVDESHINVEHNYTVAHFGDGVHAAPRLRWPHEAPSWMRCRHKDVI